MGRGRKYAAAFFQVYENDSLRDYLEDMALKGWRLERVGNVFFRFEPCAPHRIRYCVEVMEKPSVYASNQSEKLKAYREFCRDAGWDYAGSTGYLHIFYTEEDEAVVVETDPEERYERICQACQGNGRLTYAIFGLVILSNLFSCYVKKSFMNINGWIVLLMIGFMAVSQGEFLRWKARTGRSMREDGVLFCSPWQTVKRKNYSLILSVLVMSAAPLIYTLGQYSPKAVVFVMAGFWMIYILILAFVFSKLLYWLKAKRAYSARTNMFLYWGISLVICIGACAGFLAVIFRIL